ncbi:MAG: hypothetical protein ACM31C_30160 [Acidobacteriota bacterium]
MRAAAILALVALAPPVRAQPAPCPACARGDALVDHYALQPLRPIAGELARVPLSDPVTAEQYARLVALRERTPALVRVGALDDADLAAVASALCRTDSGACVDATTHTLRCLADRCTVALPPVADPARIDIAEVPAACHQYSRPKSSSPVGVGFDWATGWQRSRYPSDSGAWSFGIEGRYRVGRVLGAVARVDRIAGRDEATDANGDGKDDVETGTITRLAALAGPTLVLDNTRYEDTTRFLRVDLLGGYLSTRSPGAESGPAAGVDLAYQLGSLRFGFRAVQGFSDARGATMVLAHVGVVSGSRPLYRDVTDCGATASGRSTRLAIGMDFPLGGYGLSSELGYLAPSLGFQALWHLTRKLDALAQADLLYYPNINRDRVLHQALLAGVRIVPEHHHSTGFSPIIAAGYTHGAGFTPTSAGSGPIVDLALGWGGESADGAGYFRLHARAGIGPDNLDYRAIFISGGFEVRLDPHAWRDRD